MSKLKVLLTSAMFIALLGASALAGAGWTPWITWTAFSPPNLPPHVNDGMWNDDYICWIQKGICVTGANECKQEWQDSNNDNMPNAGDGFKCTSKFGSGW